MATPTIWSHDWRMADPRNELADIVVPLAPDMASGASGLPLWGMAAGLAALACVALAAWLWHRRRPARALQAIAAGAAQRHGEWPVLADRLDAWARSRFRLTRLDACNCPHGLDAAIWSAWVKDLTQLRFAPPPPDGWDELATLCRAARRWKRHA
jgi:hypothetical protein